jgi:hypothetical protein
MKMSFVRPRRSALLTAVAAGLVLLGCSHETEEPPDARWRENEPARYVVQTCTMAIFPPGCVRAAVEDGVVLILEEKIFSMGGDWEALAADWNPIERMFEDVRSEHDECQVDGVTHDHELGFIDSYELVCDGSIAGGRVVVCFEPDTTDVAQCDAVAAQ